MTHAEAIRKAACWHQDESNRLCYIARGSSGSYAIAYQHLAAHHSAIARGLMGIEQD